MLSRRMIDARVALSGLAAISLLLAMASGPTGTGGLPGPSPSPSTLPPTPSASPDGSPTPSPPATPPPSPSPSPVPFKCSNGPPFDLLGAGTGPNGELLNPEYRWECSYTGDPALSEGFEDPFPTCGSFLPSNGYFGDLTHFGVPPCSTQFSDLNYPTDSGFTDVCSWPPFTGTKFFGHVNYGVATYTGRITWNEYSGGWPNDHDLNYLLDTFASTPAPPHVQSSFLPPPPGATKGNWSLGLEYNGEEAGPLLNLEPWWAQFDQAATNGDAAAGQLIDGHDAVVTGVLGFDVRHGAPPEVHPVFGMAMREQPAYPIDPHVDKWAFFLRNSGNEGGCGNLTEWFSAPSISIFLTRPPGVPSTAVPSVYFADVIKLANIPAVYFSTWNGLPVLTIPNGPGNRMAGGEVGIYWDTSVTSAGRQWAMPPAMAPQLHETDSPEALWSDLWDRWPVSERTAIRQVGVTARTIGLRSGVAPATTHVASLTTRASFQPPTTAPILLQSLADPADPTFAVENARALILACKEPWPERAQLTDAICPH
jgi:hypothetical protein